MLPSILSIAVAPSSAYSEPAITVTSELPFKVITGAIVSTVIELPPPPAPPPPPQIPVFILPTIILLFVFWCV